MKIDLTCPAELWRYELPQEDYAACDLLLYNLSDKLISSVEVTLILSGKDGSELSRLTYRGHDLHGEPGKSFGLSVPVEEDAKPAQIETVIEKVWFDDNSIWRRGKGPMSEYTSNALPNSRSLENLRYTAGPAAVGFPQEQEGLWLCVCGRPNADYSDRCIRCHREKKLVFEQFNREAIEKTAKQREQQLALKAKAAREDASRLQLEREAKYQAKQKKKKRITIAVVSLAVCAALAYVGVFHAWPYVQYQLAVRDLNDGNWAKAETVFADMGDYLEAEDYLKQCRYLLAKNSMTSQDEKAVLDARNTLEALGDYEDAPQLVTEAEYLRAGLLLQGGRTAEARELYAALGDYQDSAAQVTYCDYLAADALLQSKQYDEARAAFEALGDYDDAPVKAKQAVYLPGKEAIETGEWDAALTLLKQVSGFEDADELIKQVHYKQGELLRDQGEMLVAGEEFLLAGDYQDAADQASLCFYTPADQAMQAGDYITAIELFSKISTYQDAAAKRDNCIYTLAKTAMDDMEYTLAGTYLAQLPDDYQDVADLRQECIYAPADAAYDRKDYQAAVDGFSKIPGYRDADKQLNKARYRLADSLMDQGNYPGAIAQYEILGDYSDSEKQLRIARYKQAEILFDAQDFAAAEKLYALVDGYKDSADKLEHIRFTQAEALLAAGDYAAAQPIFEQLSGHADAAARLAACDYLAASALMAEQKYLEAAELFTSIASHEDAALKAQEAYYALAGETKAEGLTLQAARYYTLAGNVQDAPAQAESLYDECYQATAEAVAQAMASGEYAQAVQLLSGVDLTGLPEKYAALQDTWQEANYLEAQRLDEAGFPYDALPYYRAVPGYKDTAKQLDRACYRILGTWVNRDGESFIFREDGTCTLGSEELHFSISTLAMSTGDSKETLQPTHRLASVSGDEAVLYDLRDNRTKIIRLTRTEGAAE